MAVAAWRARALTAGGAAAAGLIGLVVFGFGGLAAAVPLLVFFVTGTGLTRWSARRLRPASARPAAGAAGRGPKGRSDRGGQDTGSDVRGRRASQVAANGAVAAAAVLGAALWPDPAWAAAYGGAVAAAAADTWATELGVLSKRPPVIITTGRPAAPGQSGAVSAPGTGAGMAGAVLIGFTWAAAAALGQPFGAPPPAALPLAVAAAAGGFLGMAADSVLGATVQVRFGCPACGAETEGPVHFCRPGGVRTEPRRGWRAFNNDTVNFTATLAGAAAAAALFRLLTRAVGG